MILTDILQPDCIKVPLVGTTKDAVIDELADLLAGSGGISDSAAFKTAVRKREKILTTGIGHGIAVPHGKCAVCDRMRLAMGRAAQPVDFQSVDGKPVDLVFLMASPLDTAGPHIQALALVTRMLIDPETRNSLRTVRTAQEAYDIIAHRAMMELPL